MTMDMFFSTCTLTMYLHGGSLREKERVIILFSDKFSYNRTWIL